MRRLLLWSSILLLAVLVAVVLLLFFPPERWIADQAERIAREKSGYTLHIGSLDLDLLSWTPSAELAGVTLAGEELEGLATVGGLGAAVDLRALLGGEVLIDRIAVNDTAIALRRDTDGRTTWTAADVPPAEPADGPVAIPAIRQLTIEGLQVQLDDAMSGRQGDLAFTAAGSTLPDAGPITLDLAGTLDAVDTTAALSIAPLGDVLEIDSGLSLALEAALGEVAVTSVGRLGNPRVLDDLELDLTLEAADLADVATVLRVELPDLEPITFRGTLARVSGADEFQLRGVDLATGESSLQGDVRVDPATTPPTLYANLFSERLDVDALLDALAGDESTAAGAPDEAPDEATEAAATDAPDARLLSDAPLPLDAMFDSVQGIVEVELAEIVAKALPLDAIDLRAELTPDKTTLSIAESALADGQLVGAVSLERAEATDPTAVNATVELELSRLNVARVLRASDLPDDAGGRLGGKAKYWSEGTSVASLAAGLDGGVFLLMDGGELAAVLIELAGIDLFQSLGDAILPGEEAVDIRCAYADIHSEDGLTEINEFVIDTTDTVFLARGEIDLAGESLSIALEPHPKDASLVALGTAVQVSGPWSAPEVTVGAELPIRSVAVAALASLAAPALALLPLIELGGGEDSPYCSALEGALDDV